MPEFADIRFPSGFSWGCATSSHQVEGNCTNNDWWAWEQEGGHIRDGSVSGLACDHYNRFDEDFALARELGHNAHRISIEWSRIEPEERRWDMAEVDHYKRVLESLHRHELTPFVTLHHFCNPLWLRDRGGWLHPQAPELIARYSGFMAKELGDLVPIWLTINEPMILAGAAYVMGVFPPCHRDMGEAADAARNLLIAHGKMYQAIREAAPHNPPIGIVMAIDYVQPKDPDSDADRQAAQMVDGMMNEYFLAGIESGTIGPPVGQGEEVPGLKGTWDLIGLNYYSRTLVSERMLTEEKLHGEPPPDAELSLMGWEVYPEGFYHVIKRVSKYGLPVYVTENGISVPKDDQRCRYLLRHLQQMHRVISEGVDVRGYLHWTLMDNFEWAEGYSQKFGLVGMDPETRERQPRPSAYLYRDIARANAVTADQFGQYLA